MSTSPTDNLMAEHRIIEKVTAAMSRFADALSSGQDVDRHPLAGLVPFMRQFADAYHHGKEEHRLFPVLVAFREVTIPEDQRQGFIAYAESL